MNLLKRATSILVVVLALSPRASWATFSIVAVDTVSGAIGGAGASCIANSQIINDIIEGIGAVHTQAWYLSQNQQNAHNLMLQGLTPDSIIGWLVANDFGNRPERRQYGVVTLAGPGSSASFTGAATTSWAGHLTGPGYAIQGNILLGPQIIDSMKTTFLTTSGPLEDRLMAALEAAKVPGADTRCLPSGKSAISAFIRVIHIGDGNDPYLYEVVTNTSGSTDPIDVLRQQYDDWKAQQWADPDSSQVTIAPDALLANGTDTTAVVVTPLNYLSEPPTEGASMTVSNTGLGTLSAVTDNGDGTFSVTLTASLQSGYDTVLVSVDAGGVVTDLNNRPEVTYYSCGDIDGAGGLPNIADLTFLVAYLFQGGSPPPFPPASNVDGLNDLNVADLTYMVDYLFRGGAAPVC